MCTHIGKVSHAIEHVHLITGEPSGMEDSNRKCFMVVGFEEQQIEGEKKEMIPIKCEKNSGVHLWHLWGAL